MKNRDKLMFIIYKYTKAKESLLASVKTTFDDGNKTRRGELIIIIVTLLEN